MLRLTEKPPASGGGSTSQDFGVNQEIFWRPL
jgi:hypothetical protein